MPSNRAVSWLFCMVNRIAERMTSGSERPSVSNVKVLTSSWLTSTCSNVVRSSAGSSWSDACQASLAAPPSCVSEDCACARVFVVDDPLEASLRSTDIRSTSMPSTTNDCSVRSASKDALKSTSTNCTCTIGPSFGLISTSETDNAKFGCHCQESWPNRMGAPTCSAASASI